MQSPMPTGDTRLRQRSPYIYDDKCGVFMPEKNTNSATIEKKCTNKKELSAIEHSDTDANLAWRKPMERSRLPLDHTRGTCIVMAYIQLSSNTICETQSTEIGITIVKPIHYWQRIADSIQGSFTKICERGWMRMYIWALLMLNISAIIATCVSICHLRLFALCVIHVSAMARQPCFDS